MLFDLRTDRFEFADVTSNTSYDWFLDHAFLAGPTQSIVGEFLLAFVEFPPRQTAASFTVDRVMDEHETGGTSGR